LHPTAA